MILILQERARKGKERAEGRSTWIQTEVAACESLLRAPLRASNSPSIAEILALDVTLPTWSPP